MPQREVGHFSISHLSILDENGDLDLALEPKLSKEDLIKLYRAMVLGREADQRMLHLQRQGRLGTVALSTGQEAACCGPALAMEKNDWFIGAFREAGGLLMRGLPLSQFYLYWNGYEEANYNPTLERVVPITVIVGSQLPHATGIAYAMKYRKENSVVVCFFGDGATSEGDFHEALNFASVWQVPVVFICQNNQWAISMPMSKQMHSKTIAQKAVAYDMPGIQVDGNDVLATYQAAKEAIERARAGHGPTLIEAITYRLMMHTTADDPRKYRPENEEAQWWKREPLLRFRDYLEKKGIWNEKQQETLAAEVKNEIEAAIQELEAKKDFKPDAPFDHVFGTRHEEIEEQRATFLANLREETPHG